MFSISAFIVNRIIDFIEQKSNKNNNENNTGHENFIDKSVNKQLFMFQVLFINTITEELLYRGFLLNHILLLDYKIIDTYIFVLSLPVLISGLYFGFVHRSLLKMGMNKYFVYKIVCKGSIVGVACGYFYLEYNSFTAAIVVHFIANIAENISSSFINSILNKKSAS